MPNRTLWVGSGIAGILGVALYILAITLSWPDTQLGRSAGLLTASAWPILSIVYCYGLYRVVAAERDGTANRLALVFAALAFATVLAMIVVQLAVGAAIGDITRGLEPAAAKALTRGLEMIDLGLDVAWDLLIGTALIFSGLALRGRSGLGLGWAVPSIVLGVALILLNAATFPYPPADRGLVDVGPAVGLFVMILSARLVFLGRRPAS
ncbi:MAG: hypothetical protein U0167_17380 [bacterium]